MSFKLQPDLDLNSKIKAIIILDNLFGFNWIICYVSGFGRENAEIVFQHPYSNFQGKEHNNFFLKDLKNSKA